MISVVAALSVHFYRANMSQSKRAGVLESTVSHLNPFLDNLWWTNSGSGGVPVYVLVLGYNFMT